MKAKSMQEEGSTIRRNIMRCFNCSELGHLSKDCPRPRREKGSCFKCGSLAHILKDCPKNKVRPESTTNVIQPVSTDVIQPYLVSLCFAVSDTDGNIRNHDVSAMVDCGSAVSIIQSGFVPSHCYTSSAESEKLFYGIHGTKLEILGIYQTDVIVEDVSVNIKFYVVPNDAISYASLLGRDFMLVARAKLFIDGKEILPAEIKFISAIDEIMNISYVENPISVTGELNINPEVGYEVVRELEDMYESGYVSGDVNVEEPIETDIEMTINVKTEQPISFRPRRLSFFDKEKLRAIIDKLLKDGVIRTSESPYASPIVLVRKKTGDIRLCVDYRELNKVTIKENFPTPLIDDHLDQLKNKKYFSSLDLKDGFHHVKVAENSVKYTSFVTPLGQYEYLRMPFGLTNAPRIFQRFLNRIFRRLIEKNRILLYLDDILIATETLEEHLEILRELFRIAKRHYLKFRLGKCLFLYKEITYLGYLINEDGIRPSNKNVEAVLKYPIPRNVKEAHRFVCLASYFRRFIKDFSIVA